MRVSDELEFFARYKLDKPHESLHLTLHFKNEEGNKIFSTSWEKSGVNSEHEKGEHIAIAYIPSGFFNWGTFFIDLFVIENKKTPLILENDIISFTLANKEQAIGEWMGREPGSITPFFKWEREQI